MSDFLRALRVQHWIKNTLVLVPFFFALGDAEQAPKLIPLWESSIRVLAAAFFFCLISSGVYVMNDIRDRALDRLHPIKKHRPIAAGKVSPVHASAMAAILLMTGAAGSAFLSLPTGCVATAYIALQAAYTFLLKRIALVDILVIAAGFVLRAMAGAVVLDVRFSPWLMLCTYLLALFLGFCKRRHEKIQFDDLAGESRPSLGQYDERLLDQLISIVSAATIVSYALYTLSPDTAAKFGSAKLGLTIPFVIFGVFRYLDLVYRHEKGDRPERILLTDVPIVVDILLYVISVLCLVVCH